MSVLRTVGRAGLVAGGAWLAYAWGAQLLTPACVWRGSRRAPQVALTFDDGPDPVWTPRVLEALGDLDVRGTFFLVGERAARAPDVVHAIAAAGHEIASHGWSHRSLWLCTPRRTAEEVARPQALLAELTGRAPRYFRPPWGMVNAAMYAALARHRLTCVFWSIQPEGLTARAAEAQARGVLARAHAGAIVDLHDADGVPGAPARLLDALPAMVAGLRGRGLTPVTLAELLAR